MEEKNVADKQAGVDDANEIDDRWLVARSLTVCV